MDKLKGLKPGRVFRYFEEICNIPRGSGDMDKISNYCMEFAKRHSLNAICDEAKNVIIFKAGSKGYENAEPIILQGHLDMVCQKTDSCNIDFKKDGIKPYADGDFVKAEGTTLGADNGIAVAMILAILEDDKISHPPIEAVFTTDEEVGMIGAGKLDVSHLKGRKMINLDAEEIDTVTVSCAGGSDFKMMLPVSRKKSAGKKVRLAIKGLKGGHSGVEINKGRVNANIITGRILNYLNDVCNIDIIEINGGDKANAIPLCCRVDLAVEDADDFKSKTEEYIKIIKSEIAHREEGFEASIITGGTEECDVLDLKTKNDLIFMLTSVPNGVVEMSAEIEGLVETSLNLGILKTDNEGISAHFALRSNKKSALDFLEARLKVFADYAGFKTEAFGHYPPWEFNDKSKLQGLYKEKFRESFGYEPEVVAIHAGLECGMFSAKIQNLDCIAVGPQLSDVHTVNESLSISSTEKVFDLLLEVLKSCR